MPILSSQVGADLGACEFEATPRRLLAYAAALGVTDRTALDDTAEDFAGLPQFCVVAEWPWASDPERSRELGLTLDEARRALHMGQDSRFHQPICPGMRLRVSGRLVEVRATRSGTLTVSRIETSDVATNEVCATSWSTALFRGVALEGEARSIEARPAAPLDDDVGTWLAAAEEVPIARELPHVYTECSGIWNPIHTERRVALAMGLPDIVLHGTATWAITGRELIRRYCPGQPTRLRRLAGDFRAMVIPGTTIRLRHGVSGSDRASVRFTVLNAAGETAIADGVAEFTDAAQ